MPSEIQAQENITLDAIAVTSNDGERLNLIEEVGTLIFLALIFMCLINAPVRFLKLADATREGSCLY